MSEFSVSASERMVAVSLVLSLGLVGCSSNVENDRDHYINGTPSPHSQSDIIPEGRAFPLGAAVQFHGGTAEYHALPEDAADTGLYGVFAFCGNPIDKRDEYRNLFVEVSIRQADGRMRSVMAGVAAAEACADGTLTATDRSVL